MELCIVKILLHQADLPRTDRPKTTTVLMSESRPDFRKIEYSLGQMSIVPRV